MQTRFIVTDHEDNPLFELDNSKVIEAVRTEVINGEHSLNIQTLERLEKEQRIVTVDETGTVREYVVVGTELVHSGGYITTDAYCVWSLQHDLDVSKVDAMPGVYPSNPVRAAWALSRALLGQTRWQSGVVEKNDIRTGASMYYMSGWEALGVVVQNWTGEVEAELTLNQEGTAIATRKVNLREHIGSTEAVRRFEYGIDCTEVKRTVEDTPYPCRIIPRGKGEETETGGYGRRITIESVNGGVEFLENADAVPYVRLPNGQGGYDYPTSIVVLEQFETPAELKEYALAHLAEYTSPNISYEASMNTFEAHGMNTAAVKLGDVVQVVDSTLKTPEQQEGFRAEARVVKLVTNELDTKDAEITISNLNGTLADQFTQLQRTSDYLGESIRKLTDDLATTEWVSNLITRISAIEDSGWQPITLESGFEPYTTTRAPRYRKIGKLVQVTGEAKATAEIAANQETTMFTLPAGFRPSIRVTTVCTGTNMNRWSMEINYQGNATITRYGTTTNSAIHEGAFLPFNVMYYVD